MLFAPEIDAPPSWISATISTRKAVPDEIAELVSEIRDLKLKLTELPGAMVVERDTNATAMTNFENGVVPDLITRDFRVTWNLGGGLCFRSLDSFDQALINGTYQLGALEDHAGDEL